MGVRGAMFGLPNLKAKNHYFLKKTGRNVEPMPGNRSRYVQVGGAFFVGLQRTDRVVFPCNSPVLGCVRCG